METYTFLSNKGDYVTVEAANESEAREQAMRELYGSKNPIPEWLGAKWLGLGLMLKGEA